jgi:hypothetical protein
LPRSAGARYLGGNESRAERVRVSLVGVVEPFATDVPNVWDTVHDVRDALTERLGSLQQNLRDAIVIAAAELAENILKYSARGGKPPLLAVEVEDDRVVVRSENDVAHAEIADEVLAIVRKIQEHADPVGLYAEAIDARLAKGPQGATQQGFYRIAAVAEFELEARREGLRLFIKAERAIR